MITLRLDKNGGINKGDIKAFEHDNLSEVYIIQLYKNGAIYDLTNKSIELTMVERKRKIGDMVTLPIYEATEGKVKLEVVSDITKQDGIYDFKLTVKDTAGLIETFPSFQVEIKNDITDSITGEIIQDPNFTILTDGLKALADYNIYKTNALKVPEIEQDIIEINSQLDTSVKFKVIGEGASVPPISGGGSGGGYVHPATHPASMITGLSNVATSGLYSDLIGVPTKLSQFINDITISDGGGTSTGTISNSLDNYAGNTLNDKMVAMFNDINTNHKNTPMIIILPDGIIEITSDLKAIGWTNKILIANSYLNYKNCNAIEFIQCMHCNFYVHASSSSNLDIESGNIIGLINPSNVGSLTKRGYKITDCSYNEFKFNNIIGFTNGIEVYSEYGAKGTFYNNIYFTAIWRCQRPMIFRTGKASDDTAGQSGWITEIYVHGGMFDCDDGVLIGQEVNQRPANEPSDNYQGLKFYNIGVEHIRKKQAGRGFYFLQGKNNAIINPRFEGSLNGGNSTSGAYILVEESGYACNNRIETSNYPINVDRVRLNYLTKQLANPSYDNHAGSYIEGDLYDNNGFKCGCKAIATPGKMVYEAKNLSNYYLNNAKNNTFNYTYSDTEFAKVKCSDGTIKTIGYTS